MRVGRVLATLISSAILSMPAPLQFERVGENKEGVHMNCWGSGPAAQRHPLTDIPPEAPGIESKWWFPKHASLQFPAGDTVEALVGLHNGGDDTYNVSAIYGSLHAAHDYKLFFQNFSGQPYFEKLRPGDQVSLSYTFTTAPQLPAREFLVALTVFYNTESQGFATTFFNRTIDVVDQPRFIDTELIFLWTLILALLAGGGWLLYSYLGGLPFLKKRAKRSKRVEPVNPNASEEWLKGTNYSAQAKPSRKGSSQLKKAS